MRVGGSIRHCFITLIGDGFTPMIGGTREPRPLGVFHIKRPHKRGRFVNKCPSIADEQ